MTESNTDVPDNVTAKADGNEILLTWDAAESAESYSIRRHDGTGWSDIATVYTTAYKDVSVEAEIIYIYTVTANGSDGAGAVSEPAAAIIEKAEEEYPELSAPVVSAEADENSVVLRWNKVDRATSYNIIRYDGESWKHIATVSASCYSDIDVDSGVSYTYAVYALAGIHTSAPSDLVTAKPLCEDDAIETEEDTTDSSDTIETTDPSDEPTDTDQPTDVTAAEGEGAVTLEWNKVTGAEHYRVMVYDGTKWTGYNTADTSYTVSGLTGGKEYAFAVKAYINGAYGETSEVVYATPYSKIDNTVPADFTATTGEGYVELQWSEVTGAEHYRVMVWNGTKWTGYNTTQNSYTVSGLTDGMKYGFAVKAYINGAYSETSAIIYAVPNA